MIKRYIEKFKRDNRGSAIVVVMVAMAFIVILGSILLYLSLVNIQMKNLDRSGKANFYDAESVMNEVRADVQGVVSDAINQAYTDVLNQYNDYDDDDARETDFKKRFFEQLYTMPLDKEAKKGGTLFVADGSGYYPDQLAALIGDVQDAKVILTGSGNVFHAGDASYIKLVNVSVRYIDQKGFETAVSSDIRIEAPTLESVSATVTQSSMPNFTIIAQGDLAGASFSAGVTGSAYAGTVTVSGTGYQLAVSNSANFVCAGDVTAETGTVLSFSDDTALWAKGIILKNGSGFTMGGDAYIKNDLNLLGEGAAAVLGGRYFGYGNSSTDPDGSSSIIVNGLRTELDMSAIDTLVLAGRSFVDYGTQTENGSYVLMGQSVAVKSDQLAYLLPENCLSGVTNPYPYLEDYDSDPGNSVLQSLVLLDEEVVAGKTLADYGIAAEDILCMREIVGSEENGTRLIYFCMQFPTAENANAYFADYFTEHAEDIQKYLNIYCAEGYALDDDLSLGSAGGVYDTADDETGAFDLIGATGVPPTTLEAISDSFSNLCVTLSRADDGGDSGAATPYAYYVDDIQLKALGGSELYYHDGVVKAVASSGDYTVGSGTPDTVHVVIAAGNVTVSREFTGLIIAGGNVILKADVTADRAAVADALQALEYEVSENWYAYRFLNPEHIAPVNSSMDQSGDYGWNMNALVTYENWAKNAQ